MRERNKPKNHIEVYDIRVKADLQASMFAIHDTIRLATFNTPFTRRVAI